MAQVIERNRVDGVQVEPQKSPHKSHQSGEIVSIKVTGDRAVFTRPELSTERVSYDIITPSSARGIFEQILWKPEMRWNIHRITVLNPVQHFSILRNEGNSRQSESTARRWEKNDGVGSYGIDHDRAQRHTLGLRNVAYILEASITLEPHANQGIGKFYEQFNRHVKNGKCKAQPYLGIREFTATFEFPTGDETPLDWTDDLGLMLHGIQFVDDPKGKVSYLTKPGGEQQVTCGIATPRFFRAVVNKGVMQVPAFPSPIGRGQ